jgi:uncharacterized membrane protein
VLVLIAASVVLKDTRFMLAYPTFVNVMLLGQFGWSLLKGPPMVERFARLQVASLTPGEVRYCRHITMVWCAFFVLNAAVVSALALLDEQRWWALYAGALSYGAMGLLFAVEFTVRKYRFGRFGEGLADRVLKALLPRRPGALDGES